MSTTNVDGRVDTADVIVVGAGPGGSATAAYLAMAGLDVLLLEKTHFPREKVCGDGLTPRAVRELVNLGIATPEEDGWIRNKGLRHGPPEVMDRLRRGEEVDPAEYYFRTVPEFIAPEGPYDWLNKSIFVCSGARYASSIKLWVWRVT